LELLVETLTLKKDGDGSLETDWLCDAPLETDQESLLDTLAFVYSDAEFKTD